MKTGAQGVGRRLGLFCCPAIWSHDGEEPPPMRVMRRDYAEDLRQMRRTIDWGTCDGLLPGEALEVRELWLASRGDACAARPAYPPSASPCLQVRTTHTDKETYNVEKMFGTDQPMKLVLCDCGGLRLTSGPMTIHFTREEFQMFAGSIGRLAAIVAQPSLGQVSAIPQATPSEVCH